MDWKIQLKRQYETCKRFIYFVVNNFFEDDCTYRASALAFTSLLAIVPLMTVGLSILSSFPVFQGLIEPLQNFIFANFVPATGAVIQTYIQQFTAQVSKLPVWGVIFLIVTALLVMVTIERAMNKIWRVNCARHGVSAFLLYWTILSLAPVLLGLSLAASSYLFSLPLLKTPLTPSFLLNYLPFFLSLIGFTFLYVVVPNRPVQLRHGFWGALFATVLFESAKHAFAYYLGRYNTYQLLYGAFATVPIFFVWVYWVWIITLMGAEISYALAVHHQRRQGQPLPGFLHALLWLYCLWQAQQNGRGLSLEQLTESSDRPYAVDIGKMIEILEDLQLIHSDHDETFHLSRNLGEFSVYWLSQQLPFQLPSQIELKNDHWQPWSGIFNEADKQLKNTLSISLHELFGRSHVSANAN
ncbi:ribonuclease BN [Legionella birminghamensis]|uniref:UPF0761 membrane protein Lbir_1036 n=1 Tax=Legionella birminghamensis TaxID=28083 RepID=A0A378I6A6_9GAMM|nr:YihY family inner membrane protein [Legionella birminghamensis]KTC73774.1 ribonuclease BN [Legionella birminghamensis]STX30728.1 ribonuclease BN [Legionella birminghamensis]